MSTRIASLYAEISADTTKFKQGMGQVKGELHQAQAGLGNVSAEMSKFDKQMSSTASISMQKYNAGIEAAAKQTQYWSEHTVSAKQSLAAFGAIIGTGAIALQKFYEVAKEGAQLEVTAMRFDRLAESIGTTADVLDGQLKVATSGMLSQSQRMALATNIVGLGLTKNANQTVRLAKVVSQLGADMGQVTLALTNQTTARFDQIGIAVAGFDDRLQKLIASGMSLEDAFTEAFLQQGEKQLELYGSVAETSAGKIAVFESTVRDTTDAFKAMAAEGLGGFLGTWNRINDLRIAGELDSIEASFEVWRAAIFGNTEALDELEAKQEELNNTTTRVTSVTESAAYAMNDYAGEVLGVSERLGVAESASKHIRSATEEFRDVAAETARQMEQYAEDIAGAFDDMWGAADKDWGNVFADIRDGGEFVESGGLGFERLGTSLETAAGMAANLGEDVAKRTAPLLEQAAKDSELAWLQYQVAVGDITASEAQKLAIKDLGLTNNEAYLAMTRDVGDWESAVDDAALRIQAIIDMLARLDGTSSHVSIYVDEISNNGTASQGSYGTGGQQTTSNSLFTQMTQGVSTITAQAKGGPLQNGALLGDGGGPEMVINGWVFTAEETRHLLAAGVKVKPFALGGRMSPLIDGEAQRPSMSSNVGVYSYSSQPSKQGEETSSGPSKSDKQASDIASAISPIQNQLSSVLQQNAMQDTQFGNMQSMQMQAIATSNSRMVGKLDDMIRAMEKRDNTWRAELMGLFDQNAQRIGQRLEEALARR